MADEAVMLEVLVQVAAAGVSDDAAAVFLRCWAEETGRSPAAAATDLGAAAVDLDGRAPAALVASVDRWLAAAASTAEPARRRLLRRHRRAGRVASAGIARTDGHRAAS
jgi:hypothetical protein